MIYVDDSGSVAHGGLIVYGWVEVQPAFWAKALRHWTQIADLVAYVASIHLNRYEGNRFAGTGTKTCWARAIRTDYHRTARPA